MMSRQIGPLPDQQHHQLSCVCGQAEAQPGGGVAQTVDPEAHRRTPPAARANQLAATVEGYRRQAIADGIPHRCGVDCARFSCSLLADAAKLKRPMGSGLSALLISCLHEAACMQRLG